MGKIGTLLTVGAIAGGGYLLYRFFKSGGPLGGLVEKVVGGWEEIFGGGADFLGDIGGWFSGLLGGDGELAEPEPELEDVAPPTTTPELRARLREELPGLDPLIEKAEMSGLSFTSIVPSYIQRQMARGMAQEELVQSRGYIDAMEAAGYHW